MVVFIARGDYIVMYERFYLYCVSARLKSARGELRVITQACFCDAGEFSNSWVWSLREIFMFI